MASSRLSSKSLAEANLKMLDNEALCDVTLTAGKEKHEIRCHKVILASRSPVFYAMFCGPLAETGDVIPIPDIEPSTLAMFVRYIYGDQVSINEDTVLLLLYAAKKYDVPCLENLCRSYMDLNMDPDNVCTILDQAIVFDCADLRCKCLKFITRESKTVLKSESFLKITQAGLKEIVQLCQFNASEIDIYLAYKQWASQRCTTAGIQQTVRAIRKELGEEVISLIRFPSMTLDEMSDVVALDDVLTNEEKVSVFRTSIKKQNVSKFIDEPRKLASKKCMFYRCKTIASPWAYNGGQDGLSFMVSEDCVLSAIDIFLPEIEGAVEGVLEILEGTSIVHKQKLKLAYSAGLKHELVPLGTDITLRQRMIYSVRQRVNGPNVHRCYLTEPRVSVNGMTMTFCDLKVGTSDNGTSVTNGQFYGFELKLFVDDDCGERGEILHTFSGASGGCEGINPKANV
ncbi:BTB/POZ domain-containing protein 6-like isoform X3 [Dreissena polymorpha]|uniref:BTB/POZ domain-containing protein 6-like isoform X3 n=1 Tax=Dreissena polymorpha TaxID=45954 RepID=UPI0022641329|nr:BTB/POZ domain-containing protein 6-like isoform X3 [Dreissena polymorpha]